MHLENESFLKNLMLMSSPPVNDPKKVLIAQQVDHKTCLGTVKVSAVSYSPLHDSLIFFNFSRLKSAEEIFKKRERTFS